VVAPRNLGLRLESIAVRPDAGVRGGLGRRLPAGLSNAPTEQTTWRELTRYLDLARQRTHTKEQKHPWTGVPAVSEP
jgi:hypothetical protein